MEEIFITDKQKNKNIEGFAKAHKKAAISYCRKHGVDPKNIHAYCEENSESITYEFQGKPFLTASLIYIPKVKLKFR